MNHVPIPGQYIVRFRASGAGTLSTAAIVSSLYGGNVDRVYTSAINGAAMHLSDDAAEAMRLDPRVLAVEQDEVIRKVSTTQLNATWGLDRIDQRARPLNGSYVYASNGSGVTVYIIDTGINFSQSDFGGRAITGFDAITAGGSATDCEGHGSHVAGTVGSNTYGVAKNVRLVAVRVLDCQGNGSSSTVLAGIDWVTNNKSLPAVANMSIGGGVSISVNLAVENSILAGITYAVSAGNNGVDACQQSPASVASAITVGATDAGDSFASFSNFGPCVDILAPGVGITSWFTGSGTNTLSGTSMSSPHVAGAAALYLQSNPTATPAQVRAALVGNGTSGTVSGVPAATPNVLLYTGFIQAPAIPVANFTSSCTGFVCTFDASTSTSSWGSPSYHWTFGDASSGNGKTASHTYAAGGSYQVTLTVTDPNGTASKTTTTTLGTNHPPVATITTPASNATFAQGGVVSFSGSGIDPEDGTLSGASLEWTSSRDGAIGSGASVSTSTLSVGVHTIILVAKDSQNAPDTATVSITIVGNQPPTATITLPANAGNFTLASAVTFAGTGNDPEDGVLTGASLVWTSSKDGQIGTGVGFATSSLSLGTHTITLTAKDAANATASTTRTITISAVNQPPVAAFSASCPTLQCTLDASASTDNVGIVKYAWTWGDGRSESRTTPVVHNTWATAAIYTITLTVTDAGGLSSSSTKQVSVPNASPVVSITSPANGVLLAQSAPITFNGSATDLEDGVLAASALVWSSNVDGPIGTGGSFTTSTLSPGPHTITLTAHDVLGAIGTATRNITINRAPTATITAPATSTTFQQGASVSFAGTGIDPEDGTLGGASLVWMSSINGQIGVGTAFSTSALSVGTHVIALIAKDGLSATDTATVSITIAGNQPPSASITAPTNNAVVLIGTSVTFNGTGSDPEDGSLSGASLVWTSSIDGAIGTGASFSTSTLSAGTHTITLTAKDSHNATATATRTIIVNRPPVAAITTPIANASFTQGTSVAFSGTGSDPEDGTLSGASLVWTSSRDGQIGTGASGSINTLSVGTHVITLTATDVRNAVGIATRTITITAVVNHAPVASFSMNCAALNCTADASSSSDDVGVVSYGWNWGNGKSKTVSTPTTTTTFATAGVYTVTLTVTDGGGLSNTISKQIAVGNQSPIAAIASPADNASFTRGVPVTFSGSGTDPESGALTGAALVWTSSRDGAIGTGASFSIATLSAGTHTITLTATDPQGAVGTSTRSITITPNQPPVASIATPAANATFPVGTSVSFTGAGNDAEDGALTGASLVWTSSINGPIGTGTSMSTNALSVGTHTITLTAKDGLNATGTATLSITIAANQAPIASISTPTNNSAFVSGSSVTFSGAGSDAEDGALTGASLVWTSSLDGQIGTGASFTTSSLSLGTHVVTLVAHDSKGASGASSITIVITAPANVAPTATITAPVANLVVAPGTSVTFTGSATDVEDGALTGASLVWTSSRDGQIGTGTSFSTNSLSAGVHSITLTARDAQNAIGTATRTVTINRPPVATITLPENFGSFVQGASVSFAGSGMDPDDGALSGASLVWSSNRDGQIGTGAAFSKTNLSVGTHTITLTARDAQNATATASRIISITSNNQPPAARFTSSCTQLQCAFNASTSTDDVGITQYTWTWGDGGSASLASPITSHVYSAPGTYTVTLMVTDTNNVKQGVTTTITVQ
ncbi:MAG: PKD domain-containing protein [bacterium]